MAFKIGLGVHVKDKLTGFEGITTARVEYITGCAQYIVQPPLKKTGDYVEGRWMDEDRLQPIKGRKNVVLNIERDGFCLAAPLK